MKNQLIDYQEETAKSKVSPFGLVSLVCLVVFIAAFYGAAISQLHDFMPESFQRPFIIILFTIFLLGFVASIVGVFVRKYSRILPAIAIGSYILYFIALYVIVNGYDNTDTPRNSDKQLKGPTQD